MVVFDPSFLTEVGGGRGCQMLRVFLLYFKMSTFFERVRLHFDWFYESLQNNGNLSGI